MQIDEARTRSYHMTTPSHDDVARRAYELFEERGREPGHDLEHWLDAERQLSQTFPSDPGRIEPDVRKAE